MNMKMCIIACVPACVPAKHVGRIEGARDCIHMYIYMTVMCITSVDMMRMTISHMLVQTREVIM